MALCISFRGAAREAAEHVYSAFSSLLLETKWVQSTVVEREEHRGVGMAGAGAPPSAGLSCFSDWPSSSPRRCPPETPGTQLGTAGDRPAPVTYLRLRTRAAVDGIQRNPMVGDRGAACDDRIQPHRVPSLVQVEGAQAGLLQVGGAPAGGQPFPVAAPPLRDHGEAIGLQAAALQGSAPDRYSGGSVLDQLAR